MSDLIDRQAAITAICEDGTWLESQGCTEITMCERKQRDVDILSELPPVDAVPVVRCKDCVYGQWTLASHVWCRPYNTMKPLDGFCSRGERKSWEDPSHPCADSVMMGD